MEFAQESNSGHISQFFTALYEDLKHSVEEFKENQTSRGVHVRQDG